VEAGAGAAMNWPLYTKATAAAADYEAALARHFGATADEARDDRATDRGPAILCTRPISRKMRLRPRGSRKSEMRARRLHTATIALTSLTESPVSGVYRPEFFPTATG
jgi:hypothetical protein